MLLRILSDSVSNYHFIPTLPLTPCLGLSMFDLFTLDKVFDSLIILCNMMELIDELNSGALAL